MSRADHIVSRHREDMRKPRVVYESAGPGRRHAVVGKTTWPRHRQGSSWFRTRYADMVERREVEARTWGHSVITYAPRPVTRKPVERATPPQEFPMASRPEGMTRQNQRRLDRQLRKKLGLPPRRTATA